MFIRNLPIVLSGAVCTAAILGSCAGGAKPGSAGGPGAFDATLVEKVDGYRAWTRITDMARWAPEDCRSPTNSGIRMSTSGDERTHGRKLYHLYVRHEAAYEAVVSGETMLGEPVTSPIGQVIVKESWEPIELMGAERSGLNSAEVATARGREFRAGEQRELFVMMKMDPATPGTDDGWVYATMTPDGSRVLASGRIASCMKCHEDALQDRLFGVAGARASPESLR